MTTNSNAGNGPVHRRVGRLGKTQRLILQYLEDAGGEHVSLGCGSRGGCLTGYFWEEVERSLRALIVRGIVVEDKRGFYSLPPNDQNQGRR